MVVDASDVADHADEVVDGDAVCGASVGRSGRGRSTAGAGVGDAAVAHAAKMNVRRHEAASAMFARSGSFQIVRRLVGAPRRTFSPAPH
jgi:hypothetical protein